MTFSLVIFLILLIQVLSYKQQTSFRFNYNSEEKERLVAGWQTLSVHNITQFFSIKDQIWALSIESNKTNNIYSVSLDEKQFQAHLKPIKGFVNISNNSKVETFKQNSDIILAEPHKISLYYCSEQKEYCNLASYTSFKFGVNITSVSAYNSSLIYVSSDTGLFEVRRVKNDLIVKQTKINQEYVHQVASNEKLGIVALGTYEKLWLYYVEDNKWRYEYTYSAVDNATCMTWRTNEDTLWVASAWAVDIIQFFQDKSEYTIYRAGFIEGMPSGNLTSAYWAQTENALYFGGSYGVAAFSGKPEDITQQKDYSNYKKWQGIGQIGSIQSPWNFYQGQRWITAGNVSCIISQQNLTYISTAYGLSIIKHNDNFNLNDKMYHNQKTAERHDRYGYFSDGTLEKQGDINSLKLGPYDSDAIWTNMYLAAQSYRYNVTKDNQALAQINKSFEALLRLYKVTGVPGLIARSVVKKGDTIPGKTGVWHNSTVPGFEDWTWKQTASSDDVISFYFGFVAFIEHGATDSKKRAEAIQMLVNTTDYILKNNYTYVDIEGKPNKWGYWNPEQLNENIKYYGERGINSLQIISMLTLTYKYTQNSKYLEHINHLCFDEGYLQNIINWRMEKSDEENFSDDELAYLAFYAFFKGKSSLPSEMDIVVEYVQKALKRTYAQVQAYHPSLFSLITFLSLGNDKQVVNEQKFQNIQLELEQWPMDWIDWNVDNSERQDVVVNQEPGRKQSEDEKYGVGVLKRSERANALKWNSNPYTLENSGNGNAQIVPTGWLLPYWMNQYAKTTSDC